MAAKAPFISDQYASKVRGALLERHRNHLRDGENFTTIEGDAAPDAWSMTITFENRDRTLHLPVEAALVVADNPPTTTDEARNLLADFVDFYFGEYFRAGREVTLPIDWQPFEFGEHTIRARGWEKNRHLEELADRLLAGESLD